MPEDMIPPLRAGNTSPVRVPVSSAVSSSTRIAASDAGEGDEYEGVLIACQIHRSDLGKHLFWRGPVTVVTRTMTHRIMERDVRTHNPNDRSSPQPKHVPESASSTPANTPSGPKRKVHTTRPSTCSVRNHRLHYLIRHHTSGPPQPPPSHHVQQASKHSPLRPALTPATAIREPTSHRHVYRLVSHGSSTRGRQP